MTEILKRIYWMSYINLLYLLTGCALEPLSLHMDFSISAVNLIEPVQGSTQHGTHCFKG